MMGIMYSNSVAKYCSTKTKQKKKVNKAKVYKAQIDENSIRKGISTRRREKALHNRDKQRFE